MKKLISFAVLLLMLIPIVLPLESCNDDDDAAPIVMVVAERSSGKIFTVDKATGALAETGLVTFNEVGLTNIRAMIYNPGNQTIYASAADDGGGKIYSINPSTMVATVLNPNTNHDWYGVADLLISSDNKILASLYFDSDPSGPGLVKFSLTGEIGTRIMFSDDNICCGMGIVYGSSTSQVLVSSYDMEIYSSDLSGTVTLLTTLVPEGFNDTPSDDLYIQNIVKDNAGKVYAIVYDADNTDTFLASIDLTNSKLVEIGKMNTSNNRYHALMLISQDLL
ncbi:MAG: hypothetical protein JNM57_15000 [Cyclobacteriaceae bacterium]|nr:hypothetical protein [Cyclobacteriaceae bacterium]